MLPNTIKGKLFAILVIALLGMLVISVFALFSERSTLLDDRKLKTRHLVEAATGVVAHYHDLAQKGEMTEAAAKAAALAALKAVRYEKTEYFWVNDMTPTVLMHPIKPQMDGTDVSDVKDPEGNRLFVEFVDTVRKDGAGFVHYLWSKPGFDQPVPKLSYVMGFQPWGWVIGSGIYIDDVDAIFRAHALTLALINVAVAVVIGALLYFLTRGISTQIDGLKEAMETIHATNDLSRRVQVEGKDEISRIAGSFNAMVAGFQQLIREVIASSHEVMALTTRVAASAARVADASNHQTDASAAMAAALEQTKASIEQVANNSSEAHKIAEQAGTLANQGEGIVENAATEMSKIANAVRDSAGHIQTLGDQSAQITSIVNVIKEIADQTNLLALNAAIEAARAGEQGRGFAVVADEVRKLAERTTQSTQEIGAMIDSIHGGTGDAVRSMQEGSSRVHEGVALAKEAGASMASIRAGSERVISAVGEITQALHEQNIATETVVESVERIVSMAETNGTETGAIARNAVELEGLAKKLQDMVDKFKV